MCLIIITVEQDYLSVPSTMETSFTPETTRIPQCITVAIFNDTIIENDEFFTVRLITSDEAMSIVQSTATVIIRDNDGI